MKNMLFTPRLAFVTTAVLAAALTRFLPHPPNFTAIGAMALFAGACMPNRWLSLLVPAAAMFVSDLFLGFHNTMWAVYIALGLTTMIGWTIRNRQNVLNLALTSFATAVLFFFVTNAAMWVVGFYPQTAAGFWTAIDAGIPFFSYTLISQLAYGAVLFGAFHIAKARKPGLVKA